MKNRILLLLVLLLSSGIFSCASMTEKGGKTRWYTYKVAVILPQQHQDRWTRISEWALDHIEHAQEGFPGGVRLQIEWKDEQAVDLTSYLEHVAGSPEYAAVIGPYSSEKAKIAAEICSQTKKTLILPVATSTELQRIYAESHCVWNLTQSDITQCELLLNQAVLYGMDRVILLASSGDYGRSFSDWFAFQATEMGLEISRIDIYKEEFQLRNAMQTYLKMKDYEKNMLLFVPDSEKDVLIFDDEYSRMLGSKDFLEFPDVICSDVVRSASLEKELKNDIYKGLSPSAAPESGFDAVYRSRFSEEPINGEAHLFDSFLLLSYALTDYSIQPKQDQDLNESLLRIVDGRETWRGSWLRDDLPPTYRAIREGRRIDVSGVTGDWTFDERTHASVLNTTYSYWVLNYGQFTTIEYISTDGGSRTLSTEQLWQWGSEVRQEFDPNQQDFSYPELEGRWAVVIGASDDWKNYRHQADALAMYQLLRRHGYDDEHILLVMEDNIAYHEKNIYPGVVKVRPDGENLYHDVQVDYHLSDITVQDLKQIMLGRKSERLPHVIDCGPGDNLIMFWCGHGAENLLKWGNGPFVNEKDIRDIFVAMRTENRGRKVFFALDACFAGTIGEACEGLPGLVVFTAANAYEPSHADMRDPKLGVWLSNGFTRAFQETIDENSGITLRELYYSLARHTVGSHATVYNAENYGNMYTNDMREYLK